MKLMIQRKDSTILIADVLGQPICILNDIITRDDRIEILQTLRTMLRQMIISTKKNHNGKPKTATVNKED